MNRYNYYTGEPENGSPNIVSTDVITTNMNIMSNNQGQPIQYNYDPNMRYMQMNQSPMIYQPGAFGYNMNPPQQFISAPNPNFMNPPVQQLTGFTGFVGNPALSMLGNNGGYNNQYGYFNPYQQPVYQDRVVHVPGFNTGTEVLFPENIEEICSQLQIEMMIEQDEAIEERNKRFQGYFNNNYGANYYGMPFFSTYMDQSILNKYRRKIEEIKQEAVEKRIQLNKRLSKLAHNYINDGVTDEDIDRIYDGYSYTITANQIKMQNEYNRFANMVPVSNQHIYAKHFEQVSNIYNSLTDSESNMEQFLQSQGLVEIYNNLEEEMHKRKDGTRYYQEDGYKRFLRKAINKRKGIDTNQNNSSNSIMNSAFPLLSQNGSLLEDGTISITTPSWLGNRQVQINNELEQHFEENRRRFLESIYAQGD